jgi:DNA repair protein RadC
MQQGGMMLPNAPRTTAETTTNQDGQEQPQVPLPVYRLQLEQTGSVLATCRPCRTARDAQEIFRAFVGKPDREYLVGIFVDPQFRVIGLQVLAIGDRISVSITAAEVFKTALLCNALGVVLAHNHPTGDATPSKPDIELTGGLEIAGALMGIQILDHITLGFDKVVSLRKNDMMLIPLKEEFDAESFLTDFAQRTRRRRGRTEKG